ncbi:MAG: helix-hairpin-helix domain-containing protein [Myxococcota bacterium]|nr:helix-hairpin-helix domain-containing protein [Myxococcota bacterium]
MNDQYGSSLARRSRARGLVLAFLALVASSSLQAAIPLAAQEGVVNVNTATVAQLEKLPGVGKVRAQAIVRFRKDNGGIASLDELTQVRGIGEALLRKLRPHLTLEGKTTMGRR